ncbi:MAG: type IV pili methyl-accepting chemotaxis transducer N-terminal domain-containing protein, partial [Pseudomonadota bacterium]
MNMTSDIHKEPVKRFSPNVSRLSKALCVVAAATAVPSFGVISGAPVAAQTAEAAGGGKARVNRSASLRTLTETVAASSCLVNNGFDGDLAEARLSTAREQFQAILSGLIEGDPALGMPGAERRARTVDALYSTVSLWGPLNTAAENLAAGQGSASDAEIIRTGYADLFEQTNQLASVVSGQYSDPQQLLQSSATLINFAVRQRQLAYSMTRSMCELASGSGDARAELETNVNLFEQTLIALRDGFPSAGINPPPTDAVRDSIVATFGIWQQNRSIFDAAIAGGTPSAQDVAQAAGLSDALSVAMNNTITLYLIASPGQDDVYRVPLEAYARDELTAWLNNPALIAAIKSQNDEHAALSEDEVIALDQQWRAEAGEGGGPLIQELLGSDVSGWLLGQQQATAGFVTEVFVMDDKGLNVAQSVETSDYWQGDEAKWKETYLIGPDALHISEVEFDDSTGF